MRWVVMLEFVYNPIDPTAGTINVSIFVLQIGRGKKTAGFSDELPDHKMCITTH